MSRKKKQWMSAGLIAVVALLMLGSLISPTVVYADETTAAAELAGAQAEASCDAAPFSPPCIGRSVKETARILGDRIVSPVFRVALVQGLLNISQFVVNRLAYEAALVVANGGPGQGSLFYGKSAGEGFKQFGLEVAGEAVAELSDAVNSSLGTKFDLCAPSGSLFTLSLQLGIKQKYQPEPPRCDITEVINNWDSFVTDAYSSVTDPEKIQSAIVSKFAESLTPGRNELSAAIKLNLEIDREVSEKKQLEKEERLAQTVKDVKDPVTKQTKTPNKVVENDFLDKIKKAVTGETTQLKASEIGSFGDAMGGLALTAASTFTNTLLSQLFNKIYSGLFDTQPENQDPFNVEAVAETSQDPEALSRVFATTPFVTADYNALTEFVVCPPQGIANRGLNNCVMDSSFLSAISRGSSGVPLTVQEAIDEGLLNGSWSLISPENLSANQDPLCYTYGFCYSNLVKLRKARVLPIGWELAALRNSVSAPKTLQEIIDEFNNCNQYGTIDAQHPFCHLIDPNWVLKYPDTQCRATVNGEVRLTALSPGRQSVCADAPSCLGENSKGECTDGYGYCVREKNVWRFRGDECPAHYAGCLALRSTTTQQQNDFIINTVDFSVCNQANAGCQWYRVVKNKNGETFDWLSPNETYDTSDRANNWKYQKTDGTIQPAISYVTNTPKLYSYEERIYLTRAAKTCSESDAGCSELNPAEGAILNAIRNPSFEQDQDKDSVPDHWFLSGLQKSNFSLEVNKPAARGSYSLKMVSSSVGQLIQSIPIRANQFYTFSYYAISDGAGTVSSNQTIDVLNADGDKADLKGLAFFGCSYSDTSKQILSTNNVTKEWKRFSCTFSAPASAKQVKIGLTANKDVRYDGLQLEATETMSDFTEGFSSGDESQKTIKVAPAYLNCTGAATDPAACNNYAQMCQAQDVGCSLFTPDDGDPALPAIASPLDSCPAECVGYDTFKQEQTAYDSEKFPLYFIPTNAKSCSTQFVGCDSFTNLSSAAEGGEGIEYYTNLRACTTEAMADGSTSKKQSATFYTWEGSDNAGYQLRSWQLLESNLSDTASMQISLAQPVITEQNIGKAPCTKWENVSKDEVVCIDDAADDNDADLLSHQQEIQFSVTCADHDDILSNPDCREFYDADGFVHYREFSKTVSVSNDCKPYRKDQSTQDDCEAAGGYWDGQVGFCRYFGLSSESAVCPAAANGCRAYTGGAGRNSVTLLNETFESGSYSAFEPFESLASSNGLLISNESIATDGHSLRVTAGGSTGGIATTHAYLGGTVVNKTYNPNDASTCTAPKKITPAGCEITPTCVIGPGENSCGTLVNKLVKGSSFVVQFWAKGNGNLYLGYKTQGGLGNTVYDFVTESSVPPITKSYAGTTLKGVALDGNWRVYQFGPFDSSTASTFTKDNVLFFLTDAGKTFYLDNLTLKQVEENITLVKDSWVVPSTCDTAPNGVNSPQYYLGCEAYTDHNGKGHHLYQFSKLCSEKVVGCEMFYQTFQSDSPYAAIHNASCVKGETVTVAGKTTVKLIPPKITSTPVDCTVNGKTYCTIPAGQGSCTFDYDGVFDEKLPLDSSTGFGILFGEETVVVPADQPVYLVDNGKADCSATSAGCQEVGKPKYSQDLSKVESFTSAYYLNDPDQYGDILCDSEALFCDEFSSTKDGNYYFKSPLDKQCEYKASIEIDGKKLAGWFRKGKSEPCYWTDTNNDGKYAPSVDTAHIVAGDQVSIWKNGDEDYDGWVGACAPQQDLCSEFIDVVDTEGGLKKDGTSYYFINNNKLVEASTKGTGACNGQVSQKVGCALFNNRSKAELTYNASASYIVSTHADELLKKAPDVLVDPVSCLGNGGVFKDKDGNSVNLCKRRCEYGVASDDALTTNLSAKKSSSNAYYERSCFVDSDCPVLKTKNDQDATGKCVNVADTYKLANDSNTVLKVTRDRSCSAWLACDSARTSFNERTNKYEPICDSIDLCVRGGAVGQTASCTQWDPRAPEILTDYQYSARDVTWNGYELSGFAIPNQLPVELYDQFNLNPDKTCVSQGNYVDQNGDQLKPGQAPVFCEEDNDCDVGSCVQIDPDYRLVHNAGSCDSSGGNGSACQVGHCSKTGNACSTNEECSGSGNDCVIGSCQETKPANNGSCPSGFTYDPQKDACVDKPLGAQPCIAGASNGCTGNQACVPSLTTAQGKCFNNRCLTDIRDGDGNGYADPVSLGVALDQSCRGYPEVDSPYPSSKVVETWITPKTKEEGGGFKQPGSPENKLSKPYAYKTGYQDSKVCAINSKGNPSNCDCSYDKVEYGQGSVSLYIPPNTDPTAPPSGFCSSGPYEGIACLSDTDCTNYANPENPDGGTCLKKTAQDTLYGWSGYCIEKDSSIQLYASTDSKDRACLTWLPVDQLSGATDLYAKYTTAGYPPQDSYYCADIAVAYDISVDKIHCAETQDDNCNDETSKDAFNDDDPDEDVDCPVGFFAVMTGCGDASPGGSMCTEDVVHDDDWPYICVPYLSYKTVEDAGGKPGDHCKPPESDIVHTYTKSNGVTIYLMKAGPWESKQEYYNDCTVKGILASDPVFKKYFGDPPAIQESKVEAYPACQSLVQVARKNDQNTGEHNAAWTDRVWAASAYKLKQTNGEDEVTFGYTPATVPTLYGQADGFDIKLNKAKYPDVFPHRIFACVQDKIYIPVPANSICPAGYNLTEVNDARTFYDVKVDDGSLSEVETKQKAKDRLKQLFAKTYELLRFNDSSFYDGAAQGGKFASFASFESKVFDVNSLYDDGVSLGIWDWDLRKEGDGLVKPAPPKVWALGPCTGTQCRLGKEGAITVNDQDQGDVFGKGAKKITVSFFAAADSDQMPLRNIVVDWGDGKNATPSWPTDSQSGSTADDNFYKNHLGLNSGGEPICSSKATEFGHSLEACSTSYIAFNHDYACTTARVKELQNDPRSSECQYASDGRLLNSPCTDGKHCIYQPRVHVKDNWGWCTGFCDAGSDGTNGCYEGSPTKENNECQVSVCPSEGDSPSCPDSNKDNSIVNPWINYNGYVIIEPEV